MEVSVCAHPNMVVLLGIHAHMCPPRHACAVSCTAPARSCSSFWGWSDPSGQGEGFLLQQQPLEKHVLQAVGANAAGSVSVCAKGPSSHLRVSGFGTKKWQGDFPPPGSVGASMGSLHHATKWVACKIGSIQGSPRAERGAPMEEHVWVQAAFRSR